MDFETINSLMEAKDDELLKVFQAAQGALWLAR
jgi:hypothetical protein